MFQRLKKVIAPEKSADGVPRTASDKADEQTGWIDTDLSGGAAAQEVRETRHGLNGKGHSAWRDAPGSAGSLTSGLQGVLQGKPWKLERAAGSRNYIAGEEIRGRADIAVDAQVSVIIMNRPLKELLEKRAYALYTDSIETEASPTLMEEMRWLALYPQVGWEKLGDPFWHRYAVMTSQRAHAMSWVTPMLAGLLMAWPEPGPGPETPFILMVMRGKVHLRMQLTPADAHTLDHITRLFTTAAQSAIGVFSPGTAKSVKN